LPRSDESVLGRQLIHHKSPLTATPAVRHNDFVMPTHVRVAIVILLLATGAFVLDVLSPITPTPTAQLAMKSFVVGLLAFVLLPLLPPTTELTLLHFHVESRVPKSNPRVLLSLLCVFVV
jgi:hypothetical protein